MNEQKLSGLSSMFLMGAPLAFALLGGACGGSAASEHDGTSGASAAAIGGAGGSRLGSGGTAGGVGATDSGGSAASAGLTVHLEVCSLSATCDNGVIRGFLGNYCTPFGAMCEFGCRAHDYAHAYLGVDHDFDTPLASQLASDALCNAGEGGSGGEGGASGSAAQAGAAGN